MPVFVHEFFCSGAFEGDLDDSSLAREGLAMLAAVVDDFARYDASRGPCAGDDFAEPSSDRVVTTLDRRLRGCSAAARIGKRAQVTWVESPADERRLFREFAAASEATLVIAPETGGRLLERRRLTDVAGGRFLGPSPEAIELCSDKLRFCEHLTQHSLPTLPTTLCDLSANGIDYPFPIVVKPRDGAGSANTYLIRDARELSMRGNELAASFASAGNDAIVQPYLEGRAFSMAALIGTRPGAIEAFPLAEQRLSRDGRFHYRGGRIPAPDVTPQLALEAAELVAEACRSLPGLAGLIGFDLIAATAGPRMRIVEVNPRLTTSYVGYRRLTRQNLAARMRDPAAAPEPIEWNAGVGWDQLAAACVEFDAEGCVRLVSLSER